MSQGEPVARIHCLSSGIGRGHPFYLRGVAQALRQLGDETLEVHWSTPFDYSRGASKLVWQAAHWIYLSAGSIPLFGQFYSRIRSNADYNNPSLALTAAGAALRRVFADSTHPIVVDHPVLVAILRGHPSLWYQHGELVAPGESLVHGATGVFVPTQEVADKFARAGYATDQVLVSGLCIENTLVSHAAMYFRTREARLGRLEPLTAGLFSSGAEPAQHVAGLCRIARQLASLGWNALAFCRRGGRFQRALQSTVNSLESPTRERVLAYSYSNDEELDRLTAEEFERFDFFVAPSHERSNWALGLGLPLFILDPPIGSFAPLNRELLLRDGVADTVSRLSALLDAISPDDGPFRNSLTSMARRGWKPSEIGGFEAIARFLRDRLIA